MSKSEFHIPFNAPLNREDTEYKTFGCRATNPDICKNANVPNVCAFCRSDHICKHPSVSWSKQFNKLKRAGKN